MQKESLHGFVRRYRLACAIEAFEWRHMWKLRLLRFVVDAIGGFAFGLALGLAALVDVLDFLARQG